jgi:hypothetical protein
MSSVAWIQTTGLRRSKIIIKEMIKNEEESIDLRVSVFNLCGCYGPKAYSSALNRILVRVGKRIQEH